MAIGQLADYSRMVSPTPTKAILVPEEPRRDLLALARSQDIAVVWITGSGSIALRRIAAAESDRRGRVGLIDRQRRTPLGPRKLTLLSFLRETRRGRLLRPSALGERRALPLVAALV